MTQEETAMTTRSAMMADGSYGLRAPRAGGVMTVWFCGRGYRERNGVAQDVCAHPSRAEARSCDRAVYPHLTPVANLSHGA